MEHAWLTSKTFYKQCYVHSKIEGKVQRFCTCPAPRTHTCPAPPPLPIASPEQCICNSWWTYIDTSLSFKVHTLHYHSLLMYVLWIWINVEWHESIIMVSAFIFMPFEAVSLILPSFWKNFCSHISVSGRILKIILNIPHSNLWNLWLWWLISSIIMLH